MKNKLFLSFLFAIVFLLIVSSCGKRSTPFAPFDSTPTPAPNLRVEISLSDSGIPAGNVYLNIDSIGGTTNSSGYIVLTVPGYGTHNLLIPNDADHGFTNPITYSVNVTKDWTTVNIDRGTPTINMVLDSKSANVFTCIENNVVYNLKYSTATKKRLDLEVKGLPSSFSWQFSPPYVENDGDTSTLIINTPKYYQVGYYSAPVTFTAYGTVGYEKIYAGIEGNTTTPYFLTQGWDFRLKYQNLKNEVPIRYYHEGGMSGWEITLSLCKNNSDAGDTAISHINFPTQYPIKTKIINGSVEFFDDGGYKLGWLNVDSSFFGDDGWFTQEKDSVFNVDAIDLGNYKTSIYSPANVLDLLFGAVYDFKCEYNEPNEYDSWMIDFTKARFKMHFYNEDGFSMTVTAKTDFTY